MKIKIVSGVFGHVVGERVVPVGVDSDPVDVSNSVAKRLICTGMAVAVDAPSETIEAAEEEADEVEGAEAFPSFDATMTRAELEKIAISVGIEQDELDEARKKSDVLALLEEVKAAYESDSDAPTFDPSGDML